MTTAIDEYDFLDREDAVAPESATPKAQADPHDGHLHGFHYGMPFEEYAAVDALNGSKIVNARRSLMYYKHMLDHPHAETRAMALGTITHRMVLEPDTVGEIAVWGAGENQKQRRGKTWDAFQRASADKTIMTISEYEAVVSMATSALMNAPIRRYAYMPGPTEVSMFWRHPRSGRRMKARVDKLIQGQHTICDLKTTRDCRSWRFGAQVHELGYMHKMANYWNGYQILTGIEPEEKLLAIESSQPCEGVVYGVPRDLLLLALEELEHLIFQIEEAEESGVWPAAATEEVELVLPPYAFAGDEETELALEF